MTIHRAHRITARAFLGGVVGMALLGAGCGSGGGGGTATLPGGSLVPGISLPDDVSITRPPTDPDEGGTEEGDAAPVATPSPDTPAPEPEAPEPEAPEPEAPEPEPGPATDTVVDIDGEEVASEGEIWPWVLGIALVLAIAIGALAASRRGRTGSAWEPTALTVIAEAGALAAHLLALEPAGISVVARDDARRLAELVVTVEDLAASAPDEGSRRAVDRLRQPLGGLHAAVDAVSMSPTVTSDQLAVVRHWAQQLHVATSTAGTDVARRRP